MLHHPKTNMTKVVPFTDFLSCLKSSHSPPANQFQKPNKNSIIYHKKNLHKFHANLSNQTKIKPNKRRTKVIFSITIHRIHQKKYLSLITTT